MTFSPELGQQPRLLAVAGAPNGPAKQNESAMTLAQAKHLPRMPWERGPVEGNDHQADLRTGHQQRGIVEAQP